MKTINKGTATLFHATGKPYTSISNKAVEAIKNPDALAIWTFLQTKDNNWVVIGSWLQKHFGIGRDRYSKAMTHLEDMGLIHYETSRCDETGKLAGRRIVVNFEPKVTEVPENPQFGQPTVRSTHSSENQQLPIKDSLPMKEFTNNSLSSKPDAAPEKKPKATSKNSPSVNDVGKRVIDYLNEKTGAKFKHASSHLRLIAARIKDGATEDEIRKVVDRKCQEWADDKKMAQYLRPGTLFTAKNYDNYVGQMSQPLPNQSNGPMHSGFAQQDYSAGVDENGYF